MAKGKSFNTLIISSWKYAGACANPKENFRYSYFPNGDVKAFLGIESSSRGMLWYPNMEIECQEVLSTIQL